MNHICLDLIWDIPAHIKISVKCSSGSSLYPICSDSYFECRIKISFTGIGTGKKQVTRSGRHICKSPEKFKYQIKIVSLKWTPIWIISEVIFLISNRDYQANIKFSKICQLLIASAILFGNICIFIWTLSRTEGTEIIIILEVYSFISLHFSTYAEHCKSWNGIFT